MRFSGVLRTELMKLHRSKVPWITLAAYAFMVGIAGFFLWMMMNPGRAESVGLMGQKARFAFAGEKNDWPTFLSFIVEMGSVGGLIMCSIIVAYVFGREYAEGTAKNMLALPVARSSFVFAKIIVSAAWFGLLTLWIVGETWIVGSILGLGGMTNGVFLAATAKLFLLALMSLCCAVLVAWVAVQSRGYFAPLGFTIFTLVLANVFGHTGWGPWAPWSIVGLYSGAAGPEISIGWGSFVVMAATFLIGTGLTIAHEVRADNGQ
ncbi:MAG: ABC transporter permease [Spirochaetia bacterium]|jgi:ABC-2 type transport system permease protein